MNDMRYQYLINSGCCDATLLTCYCDMVLECFASLDDACQFLLETVVYDDDDILYFDFYGFAVTFGDLKFALNYCERDI